jgi:hypothetical protein
VKYERKIIISAFILILFSVFHTGCESVVFDFPSEPELPLPPPLPIGPTSGWIIIENDIETTKDCSPILTIYSEGAAYMSFSGDGEDWTKWEEYNTSYAEFNIANGLYGTEFGTGTRYVYIRFKDGDGNLSSSEELAWDAINYEMGELFSIKILPQEVTISVSGSYLFTLHGYDLKLNEVPLDGLKVFWTKCCGGGNLSPTTGLSTTYTAPSVSGKRNITAEYNNLKTGAVIIVVKDN